MEKLKLEEYQRRNEDLREKYMGHERMHSTLTDYKKFDRGDLNVDDIEKRRKIDEGFLIKIIRKCRFVNIF